MLILLTCFIQGAVFSQSCLPNGIWFSTQEEIDNFQTNYPNCTKIEGYASIGGFSSTKINNLNGLNVLTSIGGYLSISFNDSLTNLTGLENIDSIGGNFHMEDNPILSSIAGLINLTSIGGEVVIKENDSLISLSGLDNIDPQSVTDLTIIDNNSLSVCEAQGICHYFSNPGGVLTVYNNAIGCNNPPEIASNCGINLTCLPYGDYHFYTQSEIDNFPIDYTNCSEISGNVFIEGENIFDLNGLNIIDNTEGELSISKTSLLSLSGLDNLENIGGNLIIANNNSLVSLAGLSKLDSIGDAVIIERNDSLESLFGLDSLYFIGRDLLINENDALTTLDGLSNLISIAHRLLIRNNYNLSDINNLSSVTSIGGTLRITSNINLSSLLGLENIDPGSINGLKIYWNTSLSDCEVQSICDYLASPNGSIEIHNNEIGCNTKEEILEACIAHIPNNSEIDITIYPNPASTELHVSKTNEHEINQIRIYNQFGQKVLERNEVKSYIDITNLMNGIYIIEIVSDNTSIQKKLIIKK